MRNLKKLITAFPKVRVLVVGDLVADHYLYGETERVSREAPVLIVRHQADEVKLGGAANAAANARALGAQVTAIGVLGSDAMGHSMKAAFKHADIQLFSVTGKHVVTETKTRILAGGLNTTRQQMLRIDRGNAGPLAIGLQQDLAVLVQTAALKADVIIASDYGAGALCEPVRQTLKTLAAQGKRVCVDSRFSLAAFKSLTVCKPNEPELAALTGLPVKTDAQLKTAGASALKSLQCQALLVTRGNNGMALFEPDHAPRIIPVWGQEEAVDVTGAGDTVSASLAVALGSGASFAQAAVLANVAGALVVQKQGTATVTGAELSRAVADSY